MISVRFVALSSTSLILGRAVSASHPAGCHLPYSPGRAYARGERASSSAPRHTVEHYYVACSPPGVGDCSASGSRRTYVGVVADEVYNYLCDSDVCDSRPGTNIYPPGLEAWTLDGEGPCSAGNLVGIDRGGRADGDDGELTYDAFRGPGRGDSASSPTSGVEAGEHPASTPGDEEALVRIAGGEQLLKALPQENISVTGAFSRKLQGNTTAPTLLPTSLPTLLPTSLPTATPTAFPTSLPTAIPTSLPTATPTSTPTSAPTATPTTSKPTTFTSKPTRIPRTGKPTRTSRPTTTRKPTRTSRPTTTRKPSTSRPTKCISSKSTKHSKGVKGSRYWAANAWNYVNKDKKDKKDKKKKKIRATGLFHRT